MRDFCEKAMNLSVGRPTAFTWQGGIWLPQAQQFLNFNCLRVAAWDGNSPSLLVCSEDQCPQIIQLHSSLSRETFPSRILLFCPGHSMDPPVLSNASLTRIFWLSTLTSSTVRSCKIQTGEVTDILPSVVIFPFSQLYLALLYLDSSFLKQIEDGLKQGIELCHFIMLCFFSSLPCCLVLQMHPLLYIQTRPLGAFLVNVQIFISSLTIKLF